MQRAVSNVGHEAIFDTAEIEINRILRNKANYYVVLKVLKDSSAEEIIKNHRRLSLIVHPDKNRNNPGASDASAAVNQAKATLTDPLKKRLYDAYVSDVDGAAAGADGEPMSYAEWEANSAMPQIPAWLEKLLRVPILGNVFGLLLLLLVLCLLLLVVPLMIAFLIISVILMVLCTPINAMLRCCCGGASDVDDETAEERAQFEAAARGEPATARPAGEGVTATAV